MACALLILVIERLQRVRRRRRHVFRARVREGLHLLHDQASSWCLRGNVDGRAYSAHPVVAG